MKKEVVIIFLCLLCLLCACGKSGTETLIQTAQEIQVPQNTVTPMPSLTSAPTPDPTPSLDPEEELKLDQSFPWQRENSTVPDVFSIVSNDYPSRYDLTLEERTALWEMLRSANYTPATFKSISEEIDPYSVQYSLTGTYEGYYRISWYYEGSSVFHNAQLYPGNIIGAGDWYRYDADSFDSELLRKLCDVPQTVYPKTDEEIHNASSALTTFWEGKGNTVQRIWFDEEECSEYMDITLHSGPAGQRTKAKAEDTIVLLMDYVSGADNSQGTDVKSVYAVLHRTKDGIWEFVIDYPRKTEAMTPETGIPADDDLVRVLDHIPTIYIDLKYATTDNFTGTIIYDFKDAYLRYGTAKKLLAVQEELSEQGYSLKIWDAYRPTGAQHKLWEVYPDPTYVANPNTGYSSHSKGNTVDVTLVFLDGSDIEMPSEFDDFSSYADREYSDVSTDASKNASRLEEIMERNGFSGYSGEWWHYSDTTDYPIVDS